MDLCATLRSLNRTSAKKTVVGWVSSKAFEIRLLELILLR